MITTAIILAGGFGTRLQPVINDVPKPMAPVNGKPFLRSLLQYCNKQGIKEVILSVGYKGEMIEEYFGFSFQNISIKYCKEKEPLGTGGAILASMKYTSASEVFVLNGDTFFGVDLNEFFQLHSQHQSKLSLALKELENFDRYGVVRIDSQNRITGFEEKKFISKGNINGGIYILNREIFSGKNLPDKFSFEKDILEKHLADEKIYGFVFQDYFIDIGIPEDYKRAQHELFQFNIDKSWTVFLDRDGVINKKIDDDYVRDLSMFKWLPGAKEAICRLSQIFGRVIVVSNQQGIGKGLMSSKDVQLVHDFILKEVAEAGGRIDKFYFAPYLKSENHPDRKPGIGMALQAKKDFPEIDFSRSVIIGDSASDMEFGERAGMKKLFIGGKDRLKSASVKPNVFFSSLSEVGTFLGKNI